ncbi:MAG TPA: thiamine phosphate synthase [Verrucomicrobiae bacterium]|nr:thiamine phosphate synthase [Verrucomicrobiae bacterium]
MNRIENCRLYAFVDTAYLRGRKPEIVAAQLCAGGADIIQLRAKEAPEERVREMAKNLLPVLEHFGVPLVINDSPKIAAETGAAFCHLGQEDFFDAGHTRTSDLPGASRVQIGLSTHAPAQAERALRAEPAYLAIGPVYATATKPGARPVTLEYVRWASENVRIPWFAIGGIKLTNLDEVLAAGAKRVCVVSGILEAEDVEKECRKFKDRLARHAASGLQGEGQGEGEAR